jgi:hypothetical protein
VSRGTAATRRRQGRSPYEPCAAVDAVWALFHGCVADEEPSGRRLSGARTVGAAGAAGAFPPVTAGSPASSTWRRHRP